MVLVIKKKKKKLQYIATYADFHRKSRVTTAYPYLLILIAVCGFLLHFFANALQVILDLEKKKKELSTDITSQDVVIRT